MPLALLRCQYLTRGVSNRRHMMWPKSSSHLNISPSLKHWHHSPLPDRPLARYNSGRAVPEIFNSGAVAGVFTLFNSLLLIPWSLMIAVPKAEVTQKLVKSNAALTVFACIYLYSFTAATVQSAASGANLIDEVQFLFLEAVADPEKMASMFSRPAYAAQDWVHLCTWDYFVGQWIYLRGLEDRIFTRHSLLATFSAGPIGLLVHWATAEATLTLRRRGEMSEKLLETRRITAETRQRTPAEQEACEPLAPGTPGGQDLSRVKD